MRKAKTIGTLLFFIFILLFIVQCTSININLNPVSEWIEKKPFPIRITFDDVEKISNVKLYYSFNNNENKVVDLNQSGKDYTYTIPGSEVVAGKLRYYISFVYNKKKEKISDAVNVKILTLAEAKVKFEKELFNRLSHTPPKQVAINRDVTLLLTVSSPKTSTTATLYYRTPNQTSYREVLLTGSDGKFYANISKRELKDGYNTYYFKVNEMNEDVGQLEAFLPQGGPGNPFSFKILSLEELRIIMENELYQSVSHKAPNSVYEIYDLDINISVNYSSGYFIKELSKKSLNVKLVYGKNGSSSSFREVSMNKSDNNFKYTITSSELKNGYNAYYFKIADDTDDVGIIRTIYPKNGDSSPFVYRIITTTEMKNQMADEIRRSIIHYPPETASELLNLEISLSIAYQRDTLIQNQSKNKINVDIYYGKKGNSSSFKRVTMTKGRDNKFIFEIPKNDIKNGYNAYYFKITDETKDVGYIDVLYPQDGDTNPFVYRIVTLEEMKETMKNELFRRISHSLTQKADLINELPIELIVQNSSDKTTAFLHVRKPSQSTYKTQQMIRNGDKFSSSISPTRQQEGYTKYYFSVAERYDNEIGEILVDYPQNGMNNPLEYQLKDQSEIEASFKEQLLGRIKHTPVTKVQEGNDVPLTLTIDNFVNGTEVYMYHKKPSDNTYKRTQAYRSLETFTATISKQDIKNGFNQYYFEVKEPNTYFTFVTVALPKGGPATPYQFDIITLRDLIFNGVEFTPLSDIEYGTPVNVKIKLNFIPTGTKVFLRYRLADDTIDYHSLEMSKNGNIFSVNMSQALLQAGKRIDYYFQIRIDSENISFTYPQENIIPLYFYVREKQMTNDELKSLIYNGIEFTPLKDTNAGTPVNVKIKVDYLPEGLRVFLKYRINGETTTYFSVEMDRSGNSKNFMADIPSSVTKAGKRIDYYFEIKLESKNLTFTYPTDIPLYFNVKSQGNDSVFGDTQQTEANMLEGRIYQLPVNTQQLPANLHQDYASLLTLYTRKIDIPTRSFTEGFPGLENVFEWFAVQYRGFIKIKTAGAYKFRLLSDDGSKLFIDSTLIIDNDGIHSPKSVEGQIYLSKGTYPIRVDYFQGPKTQIALQLFSTKPGEDEKIFDLVDFE